MAIGEFELIRRYFARSAADSGVVVGVGDDGAVLAPVPGRNLVAVVDTLVDGVHYPHGLDAGDVGYRAVAVNVSDIAAMAATPRWMTLALTLRDVDEAWLEAFAAGLYDAAAEYGVALVGGDTTHGEQTVISINVIGDVQPGRALTRGGAQPGDDVYVTGATGEAAGGLELLQSGRGSTAASLRLVERFRRPRARLSLGRSLATLATAAIDVSDGLYDDLGKLLAASGCGAQLDLECVPLSADLAALFGDDALGLALTGGDDYELCFCAAPGSADGIAKAGRDSGVAVTRIGEVRARTGIECRREGERVDMDLAGYDHFGTRS